MSLTALSKSEQKPSPPHIKGLPFLGNLIPLINDPLSFLREQHQKNGDIFLVNAGTKKMVVLAGIEANAYLSNEGRDNFSSKKTWGRFVDKMDCPHLLIGSDGEPHSYQRKLLKPFFAKASAKDRIPLIADPAAKKLQEIEGKDIYIGPFLRNLLCQQIGLVLQDTAVSTQQSEEFILSQNTYMNIYMIGKWPRLMLLNPKFMLATYKTNRFSKKLIAWNKQRTPEEKQQFITYMDKVEEGAHERPELFTDGDIHAHTMLPFVGGIDPSSGAMSFILYDLFKYPDLRERLTKEVDAAFTKDHGFPTMETLDTMQDVKGFVYESLRLHPTGFALSRNATKNFTFSGYHVNKGDELLVFTAANHFKEEFFPNVEKFDIERYRSPRNEHRTRYAYAPFGRGPHTCVGNALAEMLLIVNTIMILRYTTMKLLVPLENLKTEFTPVPIVSRNFKVRFTRRDQNRITY